MYSYRLVVGLFAFSGPPSWNRRRGNESLHGLYICHCWYCGHVARRDREAVQVDVSVSRILCRNENSCRHGELIHSGKFR
jgi:hypothetical protein